MKLEQIATKLAALPDKRAWCRSHGLPERTVWRIISGQSNPTHATLAGIAAALKRKKA